MVGFEYLFELFTLLLGLAMAEVLAGFANLLKLRARIRASQDTELDHVRIGWLVPLLGLVILLDQSTFWLRMFDMRESLYLSDGMVMLVLALIGGYYLVSALIVPDEPAAWPDFDDYYMQHRRTVIVGALLISIIATAGQFAMMDTPMAEGAVEPPEWIVLGSELGELVQFFALIAALFTGSPRISAVLLSLVVAGQLVVGTLSIATPGY